MLSYSNIYYLIINLGPTGAGKTTVITILKNVEKVTVYMMNPKSITVDELYGTMDS